MAPEQISRKTCLPSRMTARGSKKPYGNPILRRSALKLGQIDYSALLATTTMAIIHPWKMLRAVEHGSIKDQPLIEKVIGCVLDTQLSARTVTQPNDD